ncbi:pentatricopeptide repeat-containing protein [Senna tora]|uniref:Pentatricopeptide repeat-containing protein n=1 Tax=Senna tora TaxID=362788 RepID=A0A835CEN5_9FABA|nr:pentatricopeptide repeat-containing protein [Senna tora]
MRKGTKRKTKHNEGASEQAEPIKKQSANKTSRAKRARTSKAEPEPEYFEDKRNLMYNASKFKKQLMVETEAIVYEDLWRETFPVGTEWDQLDSVYQFNWNFSNLENAFEEGGVLHGKKVYLFGCTEPQLVPIKGVNKIICIPVVVAVVSPFPPSDKIGIKSVQRETEEIIPMKRMKMDWVPYIPLEDRTALKHLTLDRLKKYEYCLPYFYQPFKEDELEQSTEVQIMFPSDPKPVVCVFDWELDELEEFTDKLIEEEELPKDAKDNFKEFVKQEVREAKKANREAREARKKAIEEMSEEKKAAYENMRFYKFYPVQTPDTPDVSNVKSEHYVCYSKFSVMPRTSALLLGQKKQQGRWEILRIFYVVTGPWRIWNSIDVQTIDKKCTLKEAFDIPIASFDLSSSFKSKLRANCVSFSFNFFIVRPSSNALRSLERLCSMTDFSKELKWGLLITGPEEIREKQAIWFNCPAAKDIPRGSPIAATLLRLRRTSALGFRRLHGTLTLLCEESKEEEGLDDANSEASKTTLFVTELLFLLHLFMRLGSLLIAAGGKVSTLGCEQWLFESTMTVWVYLPSLLMREDLWRETLPVGTENAFEEGGVLHGKEVYLFGCTEPQLVPIKGVNKILCIPVVVAASSNFTLPLWNSYIRESVNHGHAEKSLLLFRQMKRDGHQPDNSTFPFIAKACAKLSDPTHSQIIHTHVAKSWFQSNVFVQTGMVHMYIKCGQLEDAHQLFVEMPVRDVTSWNAMLLGFSRVGFLDRFSCLLRQMRLAGSQPDSVTVLALTHAVLHTRNLKFVSAVHSFGIRIGTCVDVTVANTLIAAYAKCDDLGSAETMFHEIDGFVKSVVSWNSMIAAYANYEKHVEAFGCYKGMLDGGFSPDVSTILNLLSAFVQPKALFQGLLIHSHGVHLGCDSDICVVNTLISMYSKCGDLYSARSLFEGMCDRTCVSWTAMISGYAEKGDMNEALSLLNKMEATSEKPDLVTMLSLISGCGQTGSLELGKWIDTYTIAKGLKDNVVVCNALIDMYAKCGCINEARELFYNMAEKTVVSWTTMITACALSGDVKEALDLFSMMVNLGMKPNHITFLAVLQACAHGGLLEKGLGYFKMMTQKYSIRPGIDHYSCMVDLLGRQGQLKEALEIIKNMPFEPDAGIWSALLSACKLHHKMAMARYVFERLCKMEPHVAVPYVEMANTYASAGMWDGVAAVRRKMKLLKVRKSPGQSIVQVNGKSHMFTVEDRDHPEALYIYDMLDGLTLHCKRGLLVHSEEISKHEWE